MLESRAPRRSPIGKCIADVKTRVSDETKEILERQAHEANMTLSEYVREILIVRAHGIDTLKEFYAARISAVADKQDEGQIGPGQLSG